MNTKFRISNEGIEISGSEDFVTKQVEAFREQIQKSFEKIINDDTEKEQKTVSENSIGMRRLLMPFLERRNAENLRVEETDFVEVRSNKQGYENVLAIEGNLIRVIADVPGGTQSKRMINVVLIFMWAKLQQGIETSTFQEIREFCKLQGEFDGPNFARHMEAQKKFFLISGDKNKIVRLIRPGIKEAERLLNELNTSSN